jgi:hypothetical protein
MVMSLPFLAGMAAFIFSICIVSLAKTTTVHQARWKVWQMRTDPESQSDDVENEKFSPTNPLSAFDIGRRNTESGRISGETSTDVQIYHALGADRTTTAEVHLLTRTWDYRDVPDFESPGPHIGVLAAMGGIDLGPFRELGSLTSLSIESLDLGGTFADAKKMAGEALAEAAQALATPSIFF